MKHLLSDVLNRKRRICLLTTKTLLLLLFLFSTTITLNAQQSPITVTGKVTDEFQAPLQSVSVSIKGGTGKGVLTDETGSYSIQVDSEAILVFSYVGMDIQEIPVAGQTNIDVIMRISKEQLEEVVVVGYGTQRKRAVTGSIASVKGEELVKQPVQTPTQALQGRATGIQIISSGAPNSQPLVRIRGTGTMLAGADPLYVVDGVLTTDIRNINNSDIVSVDILKDASSQAIYGLSGGNGVIIITTKQGAKGEPRVSYNGQVGWREVEKKMDLADSAQYNIYERDIDPTYVAPVPGANTDWYDQILKSALQQSHSVSLSGGTDVVKYYFSASFFGDEGIIINNKFRRYTVRSNNTFTISPKIKLITQLNYTNATGRDVDLGSAMTNAYRAAPVVQSQVEGKYGNTSLFQNVGNPILDLNSRNDRFIGNRFQGSAGIEYKPTATLTLKSMINADLNYFNRKTYAYKIPADTTTFIVAGGGQRVDQSTLTLPKDNTFNYYWDNTATYTKKFDRHGLTILAGFLLSGFKTENLTASVRNVPSDPNLWYVGMGDPNTATNTSSASQWAKVSYLGRVNYDFDQRFFVTATLRYDGTSRFSDDNRWLASPSFGAGWDITKENFMSSQKIFDFLKLKASWGSVGNDNIDPNLFIVTATPNIPYFFNGSPILGTAIQDIKDKNLHWEKLEEYDFGIEFALLKNRLSGEAAYYSKKTKEALIKVNIPGILGDPDGQYITNAASFTNKGFEFALNWRDEIGKKFTYSAGVNGTFNTNEITDLKDGQPLFDGNVGNQGNVTFSQNGGPIGEFYVRQSLGVFQTLDEINNYVDKTGKVIQPTAQPGDLKYLDVDDNGLIDNNDRIPSGVYQPDFYYGFYVGANYNKFDFSANFYGSEGGKIYNAKKAFRFEIKDNIESDYANNRWTAAKPSTTDPRIITNSTPASTYFLENGSFLRLNNITLGYTLSAECLKKAHISSFRVYITAQNLFTITSYNGFSPEIVTSTSPLNQGIDLTPYPTSRTYGLGVNVTF